ncbi:MAG: hypothetical protein LH475_09780 [Cryobacterium sp.]|nr:hypothetical protein [Cryobacterium sp.]
MSGQGVHVSFAIVMTVVLGDFLIGWRAITALVRRTRSRTASLSGDNQGKRSKQGLNR